MRSLLSTAALAALAVVTMGGCATPPAEPEAKPQAKAECVVSTGSSICRRPGSGNVNQVYTIPGEDLRRTGAPITGAYPGKAE